MGKLKKLHNPQALVPAEVLLVSSFLTFDGLHDDIIFYSSMFLVEVIKEKVTAQ